MLVDAERTLVATAVIDGVCYSYTLLAFTIHALGGGGGVRVNDDDDEVATTTTTTTWWGTNTTRGAPNERPIVLFADHDEPQLLLHAMHAVTAVLVLCAFACGRGSLSLGVLRIASIACVLASVIDVFAAYVHYTHVHVRSHPQPIGYLYAALACSLAVTSAYVARQTHRVGLALDPFVYRGSVRARERERFHADKASLASTTPFV